MSDSRKDAILNAVAGLERDAALADARLEIWLRFRDSGDAAKELIDVAAAAVGTGDPQTVLIADTPESGKLRTALGDFLGWANVPWPGLQPIRIRLSPWKGSLAVGGLGLVQVIAERKIGATQ